MMKCRRTLQTATARRGTREKGSLRILNREFWTENLAGYATVTESCSPTQTQQSYSLKRQYLWVYCFKLFSLPLKPIPIEKLFKDITLWHILHSFDFFPLSLFLSLYVRVCVQVYYSYPSVEEPHNNVCRWTGCETQCQDLNDLVRHVNADHIYR